MATVAASAIPAFAPPLMAQSAPTPTLTAVSLSPTDVPLGSTVTFNYTINNPGTTPVSVSLGAGIAPSGGGWIYDPAHDATVSVPAGTSVVSRQFVVPAGQPTGSYKAIWGLWSPGFRTNYGLRTVNNAFTATAASASTSLTSVSLSPNSVPLGGSVTFNYTVYSPSPTQVSLGAGIAPSGGGWIYDPARDVTVSVPAGTSVVSRQFVVPAGQPTGQYNAVWGLWSAGFGTSYGSQTMNNALTVTAAEPTATPTSTATQPPATPTSTPTQPPATLTPTPTQPAATPTPTATAPLTNPVLVSQQVTPSSSGLGTLINLSYTVNSPSATQVSLGAGIAPTGTGSWVYDPARDVTLLIPAGVSTVNRQFMIPTNQSLGQYDVRFGLWSAGFGTMYSDVRASGVLTVTAAPTPTPSPTGTPPTLTPTATTTGTPATPTPTLQPTGSSLLSVSAAPAQADTGTSVTLSYTVYSPTGGTYGLGAQMGLTGQGMSLGDPGNDNLVTIPAGTSTVSRPFYIKPGAASGTYDITFGFWDASFVTQYGYKLLTGPVRVNSVAQTPVPPQPTPAATPRAAAGRSIYLSAWGPIQGSTLVKGSTFSASYTIVNNSGASASIKLGASLLPAGSQGYGAVTDDANASTVSIPTGTTTVTRPFALPITASDGGYDAAWTLTNTATSAVLDSFTVPAQYWLQGNGQAATGGLSLTDARLSSTNVTLQPGTINRVDASYTIINDSGAPAAVVLRMRIRRPGDNDYIYDFANDNVVTAPIGASTFSRSFTLPLSLPSAAHDVLYELVRADYNNNYDSSLVSGGLTIVNSAKLPNAGIPILMYHSISTTPLGQNYTRIATFTSHMDYLTANGYTAISGDDVYNYFYRGTPLPAKPVWITFDDGYQNVHDYASPILQSHHLRGSVMNVTQYMGLENSWDAAAGEPYHPHMTWGMLGEMLAQGTGLQDGHTQHHARLPEVSPANQQQEIWGSQRDIVANTGAAGASFAYPYGGVTDAAEWSIAKSGYRAAVVLNNSKQYTDEIHDILQLSRLNISDSDDATAFAAKLNQ